YRLPDLLHEVARVETRPQLPRQPGSHHHPDLRLEAPQEVAQRVRIAGSGPRHQFGEVVIAIHDPSTPHFGSGLPRSLCSGRPSWIPAPLRPPVTTIAPRCAPHHRPARLRSSTRRIPRAIPAPDTAQGRARLR